jgi:1,6-anhydro-N-acetylmuramate kinase
MLMVIIDEPIKYLVCGGGRKNDFLIQSIKNYLSTQKKYKFKFY